MSEEQDRIIEAARAAQNRQAETKEFLESLKPGDSVVKHIHNPEAWAIRDKLRGAANRGELAKTECTHPLAYLMQYIDDDPLLTREGRPVNLFECGVCHTHVWFVDPWGKALSDD